MPKPFVGKTSVFGIEVVFESHRHEVVEAALSLFAGRDEPEDSNPKRSVYVVFHELADPRPAQDKTQISGQKLHISHRGSLIDADGSSGYGTCSFPVDARGTELFREAVNTITLFLIAQVGRIPIHASAVLIGKCAYVLAGRSGSGKSALALAADRVGLSVLAEDTVFVQLEPFFRVWGMSEKIHLDAKDLPIGAKTETRFRSGRLKCAVRIRFPRAAANCAALCVLACGDKASLRPIAIEAAVRQLTDKPEAGYDFYGSRVEDALSAIAAGGCWRLTLSHDPNEAITTLVDAVGGPKARRNFA